MKIETAELAGQALDWAVAMALGETVYFRHDFIMARYGHLKAQGQGREGNPDNLAFHLQHQDNDSIIAVLDTGAALSPVRWNDGLAVRPMKARHN